MKKFRYLNQARRELVYWASSMLTMFEGNAQFYKGDSLKWINSIILSFEGFLKAELKDAPDEEVAALIKLTERCEPKLVSNQSFGAERTVSVDAEQIEDLVEFALEYCRHCKKDFDTCRLRKLCLGVGIPALVETGPCQYYPGPQEVL